MKSSLETMGMLSILYMILLSVFLCACGGDGGGGGDGPAGISYTGVTTPAAIDENNAQDLAIGAYQGGSTAGSAGGAAGGLGAVQIDGTEGTSSPRTLKLSRALEDSLRRVDLMSRSGGISLGAVYEETDTVYGDCGGSASYTITVDDVNGEFSGRFNYDDYCSQGVTLSGRVSFSGEVDVDTGDILTFTFSFNNLTATSGSDSFTLRGDISYDVNDSSISVSMDMLLKDNNTGKVYWARDCTMTWTEGAGYVEFEWSGRYYDPDEGYVVVSTNTPFVIYDGDDWPSEGVLVIKGDTGSEGGITKARLTVLSSTTFQVEADTDGDGSYDWDSGVLYWSDF
jgi:hypothetical protein